MSEREILRHGGRREGEESCEVKGVEQRGKEGKGRRGVKKDDQAEEGIS